MITKGRFLDWIARVEAMEARLKETMPEELRRVTRTELPDTEGD